MDDTTLAAFRDRIVAELADLEIEDAGSAQARDVVILDQQAVGRLSRMDALQNQAMAQAQHARRQVQGKRLRAALARLEDGDYGFCEDCGDDIPEGRLRLDLAATQCVSCASG